MRWLACALMMNCALLCAADDIKFLLFTRENPRKHQVLKIGEHGLLASSNFVGTRHTKIVVHGWLVSVSFSKWMTDIKDAFLAKENMNIILVDWSKLSQTEYTRAVKNTHIVAAHISSLVNFLISQTGTSVKKMHFIGHSLGGQTVGFAGQNLNPRPARISGLDTAEPGFNKSDPHDYLDPSDADFVDETSGIVSQHRKGHADFFPNGGLDPHSSAHKFYVESVRKGPKQYPAYICKNYLSFELGCRVTDGNHMGYYAVKPKSGKLTTYYLYANIIHG